MCRWVWRRKQHVSNESGHTHERVRSHTWMSRVTNVNESRPAYESVVSYTWMSRVTHTNESRHTHMNGPCHTIWYPEVCKFTGWTNCLHFPPWKFGSWPRSSPPHPSSHTLSLSLFICVNPVYECVVTRDITYSQWVDTHVIYVCYTHYVGVKTHNTTWFDAHDITYSCWVDTPNVYVLHYIMYALHILYTCKDAR